MQQVEAEYKHSAYQGLLSSNALIGVAESRIDDLLTLGDIICKYDLEQIVGVTLAHRHHDLAAAERIVWRLQGSTWQAMPETCPSSETTPKTWVVHLDSGNSILRPTEFYPKNSDYNPEIAAAEIVLANRGFLHEFVDAVANLSAEMVFGLGLLHMRDDFKRPKTTVFETSSIKNRTTQAVVISSNDSDSNLGGVTLWHFTKNGGPHGQGRCAHGSTQHCCGD